MPAGQEAAVDNAMSSMDRLVDKEQRTLHRPSNSLVLSDVVSSGRAKIVNTDLGCIHHAVESVAKVFFLFCFFFPP